MLYEHKVIFEKLLQGTGIVPALDLGHEAYRYGDTQLFVLDCKAKHPHLTQWAAWYSLQFMSQGVAVTTLAIRWTGVLRVQWDRMYEPATMIFGRHMTPNEWAEHNPHVTHGTLLVKGQVRYGVHTREAI